MKIKRKSNIIKNVLYSPREIAKLGLINSMNGNACYNFILKKIRAGEITAKNIGKGDTPYYVVKGSELLKYRADHILAIFEDENDLILGS